MTARITDVGELAVVEEFNRKHPVGTIVRYWKMARGEDEPWSAARTRTPAQLLSGHTAVVWVEGEPACIALTHVQAMKCAPELLSLPIANTKRPHRPPLRPSWED